jgi:uncharacterized protein YsxB (DUF464 family)
MINVHIERFSEQVSSIIHIEVKGHADFDTAGKDLVCAAVSAITVGTLNAIEVLTEIDLKPRVKSGFLSVSMANFNDLEHETRNKIQLLLESMVVMLQTIQESYQAYITIRTTYSKGG